MDWMDNLHDEHLNISPQPQHKPAHPPNTTSIPQTQLTSFHAVTENLGRISNSLAVRIPVDGRDDDNGRGPRDKKKYERLPTVTKNNIRMFSLMDVDRISPTDEFKSTISHNSAPVIQGQLHQEIKLRGLRGHLQIAMVTAIKKWYPSQSNWSK